MHVRRAFDDMYGILSCNYFKAFFWYFLHEHFFNLETSELCKVGDLDLFFIF